MKVKEVSLMLFLELQQVLYLQAAAYIMSTG